MIFPRLTLNSRHDNLTNIRIQYFIMITLPLHPMNMKIKLETASL